MNRYRRYNGSPNLKNIFIDSGIVICALVFVITAVCWVREGLIAAAAAKIYNSQSDVVSDDGTHMIDFVKVQSSGTNAQAWLYIPDTEIDYPLVQGSDNDYYIDHDAYGNESSAGAIFINFANSKDMTDPKTVIFGHNMRDGSMFSGLHSYNSESYAKEHDDAYIYLSDGTVKHYKALYYILTVPTDESIYVINNGQTGESANEALKENATLTFGEYEGGNLVCLSTCTMHDYRTVVVFEEVDNETPDVTSAKEHVEEEQEALLEQQEAEEEEENTSAADLIEENDYSDAYKDARRVYSDISSNDVTDDGGDDSSSKDDTESENSAEND